MAKQTTLVGKYKGFWARITSPIRTKFPFPARVAMAFALAIIWIIYFFNVFDIAPEILLGPIGFLDDIILGIFSVTIMWYIFHDIRGKVVTRAAMGKQLTLKGFIPGTKVGFAVGVLPLIFLAFSIVYLVFPFDVIPDFSLIGFGDDLTLLIGAMTSLWASFRLIFRRGGR